MFMPRFYQEDCLRIIAKLRAKGIVRAFAVMASGLGKTVTMAFDVLAFRKIFPKARVLYLCHQNYISNQSRITFEAINGVGCSYGFYNGFEKSVHRVDFLFASFQTMRNDLKKFNPSEFDYVVVDESHRAYADTFLDVVSYWKPKFLLGMTATPDRTDGQDVRDVFGQEVFCLPLEEALAQGLLTPVDYRLMSDEIQLKKVFKSPERRLSLAKLNRTIFIPRRDQEIASVIEKHSCDVNDPRRIIFCQTTQYCDHLSKYIDGSVPFHSKISANERIVRLEMFRQGLVTTLLTVDVFNEGIDIPPANVLVFLRSTTSPIVFMSQLGRGLRISEGKEKVVVLDFVGNCERVKTVYDLWERVKGNRQVFLSKSPHGQRKSTPFGSGVYNPLQLNVDHVQFQEKIVTLLDVVRRITAGYTPEDCLSLLKAFAKKLGRSPTQMEVQSNKAEMPSHEVFSRHFGSFSKALDAAGLQTNQITHVTDDELLRQLRVVTDSLKHPPSQRELSQASKDGLCSCEPIFRERFGSLNNALKRIGLTPGREVGLTEKDLAEQLCRLKVKLGRIPTVTDLAEASARNETASYSMFRDRFKTWNNALRKAGLTDKKVEVIRYSSSELVEEIKKAATILGHTPTTGDIIRLIEKKKLRVVSLGAFYGHFKNWEGTLKAAGLK